MCMCTYVYLFKYILKATEKIAHSSNRYHHHHHPHPYSRDSHPPHKQSIRDKMAARLGKDASALGGVEVRGEGSHLSWVPRVWESPGEGGGPASGLRRAAAATAPGTRGSGTADLPPARAPAPPPTPLPRASEHRERPLLGGGGERKEDGEGTQEKNMMEGLEGIVRATAGNNSLSQPLPPSKRWQKLRKALIVVRGANGETERG